MSIGRSQFVENKQKDKIAFNIEEADLLLKIVNETQFIGGQIHVASALMKKIAKIHTTLIKNPLEF